MSRGNHTPGCERCGGCRPVLVFRMAPVAMTVGMLFCSLLLTPIASAFGDTVSMRFVVAAVMVSVVAVFGLFDAKILKDYKLTLK